MIRSFTVLLLSALLAACGARAADTALPDPDVSQAVIRSQDGFAPPRPVDARPDPVRPSLDGSTSVEVALLSPQDVAPGVTDADPAGILAEVNRNAGALQRCWEARVDALPVREGVVEIHAHIGPDGLIQGQCLGDGSMNDDVVRACANDLLAMGRYPTSASNVDVSFELSLRAPSR
jgi:hypothetical protein